MSEPAVQELYAKLQLGNDGFRLLFVQSINEHGIPVCTLERFHVTSKGSGLSYVAVSYTWGSQAFDHKILCGGVQLKVTRSCYDAIVAIFEFNERAMTCVWIDQLCIDQTNLAERGEQVVLTRKIYAGAQSVVMWLDTFENLTCGLSEQGEDIDPRYRPSQVTQQATTGTTQVTPAKPVMNHEVDETVNLLQLLSQRLQIAWKEPNRALNRPASELPITFRAWDHVVAILRHRYFSRLWILQEILHDKKDVFTLLRGRKVGLNLVSDILLSILSTEGPDTKASDRMHPPRALFNEQWIHEVKCLYSIYNLTTQLMWKEGRDILKLLDVTREFQMTEAHDRVYALHALADNTSLPRPDYTISNSDMLIKFALQLISQGRGGDMLSQVDRAYCTRQADVPSWCPTWQSATPQPLFRVKTEHYEDFMASGHLSPEMKVVGELGTFLQVRGAIIDKIQTVTRPERVQKLNDPALHAMRKSTPQSILVDSEWAKLTSLFTQSFATAVENLSRFARSQVEIIEALINVLLFPEHQLRDPSSAHKTEKIIQSAMNHGACGVILEGRSFCTTESGYLGIAHCSVQVGDLVVIIAGVAVTLILRESIEEPGKYEIICDSFFKGLGKGEGVEKHYYGNERDFILM